LKKETLDEDEDENEIKKVMIVKSKKKVKKSKMIPSHLIAILGKYNVKDDNNIKLKILFNGTHFKWGSGQVMVNLHPHNSAVDSRE
jgi:hypothetical protein